MSSVTIWHDPDTGVAADWNKGRAYSVSAPGDAAPRYYPTNDAAVRAAKRLAHRIRKESTHVSPDL